MEDGKERMVRTPWSEKAIPFHEAARIGTQKVIEEHSTIGLVITSDGSFGELPERKFYRGRGENHSGVQKNSISPFCGCWSIPRCHTKKLPRKQYLENPGEISGNCPECKL